MIPPAPIGLFDARNEESRLKVFNYRVAQERHEPTVNPVIKQKIYQMPQDIRNQNNIGIHTNPMYISLPCKTVQEANGKVVLGNSSFYDRSTYNIKPRNWDSPLTYVPERAGFSHNFTQTGLKLHTY